MAIIIGLKLGLAAACEMKPFSTSHQDILQSRPLHVATIFLQTFSIEFCRMIIKAAQAVLDVSIGDSTFHWCVLMKRQ